MVSSHKLAVIAGMASVLILAVCVFKVGHVLGESAGPKSYGQGDSFSIAQMRAGDRIEVTKKFYPDVGEPYARLYQISGAEQREFTAIELNVAWKNGALQTSIGNVVASLTLTPAEIDGMDVALLYLRKVAETPVGNGTARHEYRAAYFRNGTQVGETFVADDYLLASLAYEDTRRRNGEPARDLGELARDVNVAVDVVRRMKTFEMLEHEGFRGMQTKTGSR